MASHKPQNPTADDADERINADLFREDSKKKRACANGREIAVNIGGASATEKIVAKKNEILGIGNTEKSKSN